jgi:hypothetical protein
MRFTIAALLTRTSLPSPYFSPPNPHSLFLVHIINPPLVSTLTLALVPNDAGAKNVGTGTGAQFITGGCVSNADCSSACCSKIAANGLGICSAEAASLQNGKTGCGFSDPNKAAVIKAAEAQVKKQGFRRVVRQE